MSAVIQLPNPINLRAGISAVRERATILRVPADALRQALAILFREMQAGRSTAAAVALANSSLRGRKALVHGTTPPSAA